MSESKKPAIPKYESFGIPRPQSPNLQRPYAPGREGFFDVLQEVMFDHLKVDSQNNLTIDKHFATVYRVEQENGFLDSIFGASQVRVRARIDEPDITHSTVMIPETYDDQSRIDLLVEFSGDPDKIGGTPKLGDVIEVSFYNKANKTKLYGNGQIERIVKTTKVAGGENPGIVEGIVGKIANFFKPTPDDCTGPGNPSKSSVTPAGGAAISGENRAATVSERNPRKLNSPTEDSTAAIQNSRLPEQEQPANVPGSPPTANPDNQGVNARSAGPGPFEASPGTNATTPSGGSRKTDPCDGQILAVGNYRNQTPQGNKNVRFEQPLGAETNSDKPEPTWDKRSDRLIKTLHPDIRKVVSQFINYAADKENIYLRVTSAYRTVQKQDSLYAVGRTVRPGAKKLTNARGLPKSSIHQFGVAFDCAEIARGRDKRTGKSFKGGQWGKRFPKTPQEISRWKEINNIAKRFGFIWGGNFRGFYDPVHFEPLRIPGKAKALRKKEAAGDVFVDPDLGPNYVYPRLK